MEKNTDHKLSIIVPCYNCENTLAEAVNSCFTQNLSDFEIIMVDDGSTDGTRTLMESLSKKHPEIRLVFHEKNMGGGAARNTGIRAAKGTFIFCLDSDDILNPGSMSQMITFLIKEKADGVIFHERRFFIDKNHKKYNTQRNKLLQRPITLEDLFNENNVTVNNFLYTKESYMRVLGGYPEHHGFDTQTFEISYIAIGNRLFICPESIYLQRQGQKGRKSYFEREYEKGLFSINTFLSLEPALHLLSDDVINLCLDFDILFKNKFGHGENLLDAIKGLVKQHKPLLLQGTRSKRTDLFIKSSEALLESRNEDALNMLNACIEEHGSDTPLTFVMMVRIRASMKGADSRNRERETEKWLREHDLLHPQKMRWVSPLVSRIYSIVKSIIPRKKHA